MRDKRSKFVALAESRVNKTIKDLRLIGNLSNRSAYQYGEDDVRKIFKALQKELDSAKGRFTKEGPAQDDVFRIN
jgi:hypothetical protein